MEDKGGVEGELGAWGERARRVLYTLSSYINQSPTPKKNLSLTRDRDDFRHYKMTYYNYSVKPACAHQPDQHER